MNCNYDQIREENLKNYGSRVDKYGPVLLANLYSDRTHFLFELLQNAEDAKASYVKFRLYRDRLEFIHNGKPFDERDVRGICGIVEGTKTADKGKIGTFGIGFKSVYAYTSNPRIYSGQEAFEIRNYVHPRAIENTAALTDETLFLFPFDHEDVKKEQAYAEILKGLERLELRTLLFLTNIGDISWDANGMSGRYRLELLSARDGVREARISSANSGPGQAERWLVFAKDINQDSEISTRSRVEVAYRILTDGSVGNLKKYITSIENTHLVVFFPTRIETHLKFLIQGPYKTTPTRESISFDDPWNIRLVEETAILISESICHIKDEGLLSINFLNLLPIRESDFPRGHFLRPIFDKVMQTFKDTEPLLPAEGGGFVIASNALLARGRELISILSMKQLEDLLGRKNARWIDSSVTENTMPDLRKYLIGAEGLGILEVTPEKFAQQFNYDFISKQDDTWLIRFYKFLKDQPALWRGGSGGATGAIRNKPFIRLSGDKHVAPFDNNSKPNAYLYAGGDTAFPTVKTSIIKDGESVEFLKRLGLFEPDEAAEVLQFVLPKYEKTGQIMSDEEHLKDIQKILRALNIDSQHKKDDLQARLKVLPFVKGRNINSSIETFKKPGELYFSRKFIGSDALERYFETSHTVAYLSEQYLDMGERAELTEVFRRLGVEDKPRRFLIRLSLTGQEKRAFHRGECTYDRPELSKDYELEGLAEALKEVTPTIAAAIWESLLLHVRASSASDYYFKGEYHWFYRTGHSAVFDALFIVELRNNKWIPSHDGKFRRPADTLAAELPDFWDRESSEALFLISRLGFKKSFENEYLSQLTQEERQRIELAREIPLERLRELTDEIRKIRPVNGAVELDYTSQFRSAFAKKQQEGEKIEFQPPGPIGDPEIRLHRVKEEIEEHMEAERPQEERFRRIPRTVWEGKAKETREFLKQQYGGRCQICGFTFFKRNNEPYFEGLYIVSRTKADWMDRPGNALCLCANCCAKFEHGEVRAEDIQEHIQTRVLSAYNDEEVISFQLILCGEAVQLHFSPRHLIDLQALLRPSS